MQAAFFFCNFWSNVVLFFIVVLLLRLIDMQRYAIDCVCEYNWSISGFVYILLGVIISIAVQFICIP